MVDVFVTVWINLPFFCINGSEIKERIKKTKDEKKAKKAEVTSKKSQGKGNVTKGGAPKGPKLGGGGGKRWSYIVASSLLAIATHWKFCMDLFSLCSGKNC